MYRFFVRALLLLALVQVRPSWSAESEQYMNLTLDHAVRIALEQNRDIVKADEEARKADHQITEAASTAYPQINGNWNFSRNLKPMVFVISFPDSAGVMKKNRLKVGTDNSVNLGTTLTQPLYVGGKVGTALKAAKLYKKMSLETLYSIRQNVVAGVVMAFNSALLAEEMHTISMESLEQAENHLNNVKNLFNAGRATEYDLLRVRVQVANMKPNLLEAENQVTVSRLKLKEAMGVSPDAPVTLSGSFAEPDTTLLEKATVELALDNRPDLKASGYNVDLYEKSIQIARGDFLPILTAGSTFAFAGNFDEFKYDAADWNRAWTANLTLTFPIFSGFKNSAKYREAQADFYKAKIDYRKAYDAVLIEVREDILNLRKAMKTIESQRMNVEEAEKALSMAESLYTNGKATQLDVLDTQLALKVAKTNMAVALYESTVAETNLKKSLGILNIDK